MAKVKGLTLSRRDVSQTINLEELLGVSFAGERALRLAIAQKVIDHIIERTQSGADLNGKTFKPYSSEYKESAEYKILKSGGKVNMTLTGNMLGDIDVLSDGPNTIHYGFEDPEEIAKAYRHNTGDAGMPKREFFGVTEGEARDLIMSEFGSEIRDLKGQGSRRTIGQLIADGVLLNLLDETSDQSAIVGGE